MLTRTSVSAIRTLTYLGLQNTPVPQSPRAIAAKLDESPTYLAKVVQHLARAGILRAHRGVAGGVVLSRPPERITLLAIVEACQGAILGDVCSETTDLAATCAFHQAGAELHQAIVGVLSRWTLADFLRKPRPRSGGDGPIRCWLEPCPLYRSPAKPPRAVQARKARAPARRRPRSENSVR